MGQYHLPISLTSHEKLQPSAYDDGNKLLEMACSQDGVVKKLGELLQSSWKGHRIAIIGDYCEAGDLAPEAIESIEYVNAVDLYDICVETFDLPAEVKFISSNTPNHVIVNLSKNQFLKPTAFGDKSIPNAFINEGIDGGVMTALFGLLAVSCKGGARGGGDIDSSSELIGSWGGDRIAIISEGELLEGAVDISSEMRNVLGESGDGTYDVQPEYVARKMWDYDLKATAWKTA